MTHITIYKNNPLESTITSNITLFNHQQQGQKIKFHVIVTEFNYNPIFIGEKET